MPRLLFHPNAPPSTAAHELPKAKTFPHGAALHWTAHPLVQGSAARSVALCGAIMAFSVLAADAFGHLLFGLVSFAVLAASMSRYLLPTHYVLDETGVICRHLFRHRRLSWARIRRADVHRDGLFLSPFPRSCRLDSFRGVFLRFHENDEAVTAFAQAHVAV